MLEHLVKSHLGCYYISDLSETIIQRTCEHCFDSDEILTSWKKDNKEEQLNKIIEVLNRNTILSTSDLLKYIESDMSEIEIKEEIKYMIEYFTNNKKRLVRSISYDSRVDNDSIKKLKNYIYNIFKEQLEFINNYDFSKINNQKIKKISYNKKTQ